MIEFTDFMLRTASREAAERTLTDLLGFAPGEQRTEWSGWEHPSGARLTLTERDFGSDWALACRAGPDLPAGLLERHGFRGFDSARFAADQYACLRSPSGLTLILYP
jgi:hypothetical protein